MRARRLQVSGEGAFSGDTHGKQVRAAPNFFPATAPKSSVPLPCLLVRPPSSGTQTWGTQSFPAFLRMISIRWFDRFPRDRRAARRSF